MKIARGGNGKRGARVLTLSLKRRGGRTEKRFIGKKGGCVSVLIKNKAKTKNLGVRLREKKTTGGKKRAGKGNSEGVSEREVDVKT